jgi:hypothetical protein
LKYDYKVARPTYQIETGTLPPLYLGCKNVLSVQSAALGPLWNPSFGGNGAEFINSGKGKVIIVPNSKNVSLSISNQGNLMGTEPFRVTQVPRPSLEYYINGAVADERRGVQASMARNIRVDAVADPSFKAFSPEDANFRVGEMTVRLVRNNRPVGQPVSISGPSGSIASLASQAQAGDRIYVEVSSVQRRNFKGAITDAGMPAQGRNIPLN